MKKGLCTEKDQAECREKYGEFLDWTCSECGKKKSDEIYPYTHKLLNNMALQRAGYPLDADELLYQEWLDLDRLKEALKPPFMCPFFGQSKKK